MSEPTAQPHRKASWGLVEAARSVGHLVWFERRMFEVLSSWAAAAGDAELGVALAEQARQRGWHAELWFARLPELREIDADAQVVPASVGVEQFCDQLEALEDPVVRLAALVRVVLPHEVAALARLRSRCRAASDRSLLRAVELVRRDLLEHWETSSTLLEDRLQVDEEQRGSVEEVAEAQAASEAALRSAGGILGDLDT